MSGGADSGDDLDLHAAEYVLGTLDLDERVAFAERLTTDQSARRAVAGWETRLAGLGGYVNAVPPPQTIWERIERSLSTATSAKMHAFKVIDGGGKSTESQTMRRSRDRWRLATLLCGGLAAALALFVADRTVRNGPVNQPSAERFVAAVNRGGDKPALIVRVDMKTGQVQVRPVAAVAPEGKSLELWYIGDDKKPRSMGLVEKAPAKLALPPGSASDAATFAVSVEPPGGSKTGGPTGPVVYSGKLVKE